MKKTARWPLFGLIFVLCCGLGRAQLVLGQYQDEAPVATWNTFGPAGAAATGMAGVRFTLSQDATAVFSNPALLPSLPRFSVTVGGSFASSEFYRYAIVNTGILSTTENISLGIYALDSVALAVRLGGWALGLGYGLQEVYDRTPVDVGSGTYSLHFDQSGRLNVLNISLARSLGGRFSLGLGINLVTGTLDRLTWDSYYGGDMIISSSVSQKYSGFFVNGGLVFDITDSLRLAAIVRAPYVKKAESRSALSLQVLSGPTILIEGASDDEYRQPLVAGLGLSYSFDPDWRVAAELAYVNWSSYRVTYFGEPQTRDFRNILRAGLGVEYTADFTLFGWDLRVPLRVGLALDPQPMTEPRSSYTCFSLGSGLHGKLGFLDLGMTAGAESGSGRSLTVKRLVLSLGFTL